MKKLFSIIVFLVLVLFAKGQSASSINATGHVVAEVIPIFSAMETAQMNFGRFSPGPHGGQIILTPDNSISVMGSVFKGAGTHNAATFNISGDTDASFTVTLPSDPVVLKHTSTTKSMIIENWISRPGPGAGAGILINGEQTVYVGATLKVGTLQDNPAGVYAGTYTITFDFN